MPQKGKKEFQCVSMQIEKDSLFPLVGKDLKRFLENLWIFPVAINEPEKYEAWSAMNPADDALISKLVEWAENFRKMKNQKAGVNV